MTENKAELCFANLSAQSLPKRIVMHERHSLGLKDMCVYEGILLAYARAKEKRFVCCTGYYFVHCLVVCSDYGNSPLDGITKLQYATERKKKVKKVLQGYLRVNANP